MKRFPLYMGAALVSSCFFMLPGAFAATTTLSVSFSSLSTPTDSMGIGGTAAVSNWNVATSSASATGWVLNDQTGAATTIALDYSGEAGQFTSNIPTGGSAAEQNLMSNGLRSGTGTTYNPGAGISQLWFQNLNDLFTTYDVYIAYTDVGYDWMRNSTEISYGDDPAGYTSGVNDPGTVAGLLRDGFVSVSPKDGSPNGAYPTPDGGGFNGTWIDGAADPVNGYYVKLAGLTGNDLVLSSWITGGQGQWPYGPNINGIQIVGETASAAVPEPMSIVSWSVVGLLGACFGLYRLRRR